MPGACGCLDNIRANATQRASRFRRQKKRDMTDIDTALIHECARISWPGRMSDMLATGAKRAAEDWFGDNVQLTTLEGIKSQTAYDAWHKTAAGKLAQALGKYVNKFPSLKKQGKKVNIKRSPYQPKPIAAKLLDTFMHQLVKYPPFHGLYGYLHLPIDEIVRARLQQRWGSLPLDGKDILGSNVYTISYAEHMMIQERLWDLVDGEFEGCQKNFGRSRVWLNAPLWADRRQGVS
jgi:hypothetical protein